MTDETPDEPGNGRVTVVETGTGAEQDERPELPVIDPEEQDEPDDPEAPDETVASVIEEQDG